MKVLLSTLSLDAERGAGTAQRTRFLARYLARAGVTCQVVAMEGGDLARDLLSTGLQVYSTGYLKLPYHLPFPRLRRLDRFVREADVLHILGYWNLLSVTIAALARYRRRPYVLSAAGEFAALNSDSPVKQVFHAMLGKPMIAGAQAIVTVTERERDDVIERLHFPADRVFVVPNGVEAAGEEQEADPHLSRRPYILFMGRLATIKGPDLLLEAFAQIAPYYGDVDLVFAGPDGGMLDMLTRRAALLALTDRITFTGFLNERARRAVYQQALLLVVPSRDEAMSLVAIEAGSFGKPVVLTDRCGFDEVAEIGGGIVVPPSAGALASAIALMLAERDQLSAMGGRLRAFVDEHYTWPAIVQRLLVCLNSDVVQGRRFDRN